MISFTIILIILNLTLTLQSHHCLLIYYSAYNLITVLCLLPIFFDVKRAYEYVVMNHISFITPLIQKIPPCNYKFECKYFDLSLMTLNHDYIIQLVRNHITWPIFRQQSFLNENLVYFFSQVVSVSILEIPLILLVIFWGCKRQCVGWIGF